MRILIACEESQAVTSAFRQRGFEAFSCDLLPASGDMPQYHIQGDVLEVLQGEWEAVIAFPPCTHLAVSGAAWFEKKRKDGRQQSGIDFFMAFTRLRHVPYVAIENPVGIMSTEYRKPDQIIQPWQFGDEAQKSTCLWLKNLPRLKPTQIVGRGKFVELESGCVMPAWYAEAWNLSPDERAKIRSKTFPGIAQAMATQWGDVIRQGLYKYDRTLQMRLF